jgi:hypothetical protein
LRRRREAELRVGWVGAVAVSVDVYPAWADERVKLMHVAVVTKLTEFLREIVDTGELDDTIIECGIKLNKWLAESGFSYARRMHDRAGNSSNGVIDGILRCNNDIHGITLKNPPDWWRRCEWLNGGLRLRATNIEKAYPMPRERAAARLGAADEREGKAHGRQVATAVRVQASQDKTLSTLGGLVCASGASRERYQLPAETLLSLTMLTPITELTQDTTRQTKWTLEAIKAQLRLRNMLKLERAVVTATLQAQGLLKPDGDLKLSAPSVAR